MVGWLVMSARRVRKQKQWRWCAAQACVRAVGHQWACMARVLGHTPSLVCSQSLRVARCARVSGGGLLVWGHVGRRVQVLTLVLVPCWVVWVCTWVPGALTSVLEPCSFFWFCTWVPGAFTWVLEFCTDRGGTGTGADIQRSCD